MNVLQRMFNFRSLFFYPSKVELTVVAKLSFLKYTFLLTFTGHSVLIVTKHCFGVQKKMNKKKKNEKQLCKQLCTRIFFNPTLKNASEISEALF